MDIAGITGQGASTDAGQSGVTLANDFDDFLHLLTVQLQYQDPLAPMDSNQFTQQLVAFTGVEQSIATNKNLEDIVAQNKSLKNTNAVGYLGKEVTIGTNLAGLTEEGTATWEYLLDSTANSVKLTVKDENGLIVDTAIGALGAGIHTFKWDAPANTEPGTYSLEIEALSGDKEKIAHSIYSIGIVESIENVNGNILLASNGILTLPDNVLAVRNVEQETESEEETTTEEDSTE